MTPQPTAADPAEDRAGNRYARRSLADRFRAHPAGNVAIVLIVAFAGCVLAGLLWPDDFRFLTQANMTQLMRAIPTIGIISLGVGLLMIAGEYDLSVGAVFGLSSYMMVYVYLAGAPLPLAILVAFVTGAAAGFLNGWITLRFGIPSFITTLGTLFILRSGGRVISGNKPLSFFPPEWFQSLLTGKLFGTLQAQFLWFLALAVIAYLVLNRHWLGNHFFAVGGNQNAANSVGINVKRAKMAAFVLCSLFASAAGILSVTRVNSGTTESQALMELEAVAICVMGGLALTGGRGSIIGVVIGACMLHLVGDVILMAQLPGFYLDLFIGVIIVFGVSMNQLAKKKY
jgi:ribose/xylose/arabinose/galactoside ABC-type transport system permease subunit